jgi:nitrogen regulatory protein PII
MKTVIATIKPFKLDEVKEALAKLGFTNFTATEVKDFGLGHHTELYRGAEYAVSYLPRVQVAITVQDEKAGGIVQAILKAATTGRPGDGKIAVVNAEQFWNIGTDENEVGVANNAA